MVRASTHAVLPRRAEAIKIAYHCCGRAYNSCNCACMMCGYHKGGTWRRSRRTQGQRIGRSAPSTSGSCTGCPCTQTRKSTRQRPCCRKITISKNHWCTMGSCGEQFAVFLFLIRPPKKQTKSLLSVSYTPIGLLASCFSIEIVIFLFLIGTKTS